MAIYFPDPDREFLIWEGQRTLDLDRVNEIVAYQIEHFQTHNTFDMNFWVFSACQVEDTLYIIDGMHRYHAWNLLFKEKKCGSALPYIVVLVKILSSKEKIMAQFQLINRHCPVPQLYTTDNEEEKISVRNGINEYIARFPTLVRSSPKCHRPGLNGQRLTEWWFESEQRPEIKSTDDVLDILNATDEYLRGLDDSHIHLGKNPPIEKADAGGSRLGLLTKDSFVSLIVNRPKTSEKRKKEKIPRKKKDRLWRMEFGKEYEVICPCCHVRQIDTTHFHVGHIVAEANGGSSELENLVPICSECNLSMGTMHLNDFQKMMRYTPLYVKH